MAGRGLVAIDTHCEFARCANALGAEPEVICGPRRLVNAGIHPNANH